MSNTVRLHRIVAAPAERIYRAFLDPRAKCKWLPPNGFVGEVQHLDARVGGSYHMTFTSLHSGHSHGFGGTFVELVPSERIRYIDHFDDPNLPGEITITVSLRPVACGTEVAIVQENLPAAMPVEFCYLGWQQSLELLRLLVEAEVP